MSDDNVNGRLRRTGGRAYRGLILGAAAVIALLMFAGIAYLVYLGEMGEGPLVLYAGVILGYVLRSVQGVL